MQCNVGMVIGCSKTMCVVMSFLWRSFRGYLGLAVSILFHKAVSLSILFNAMKVPKIFHFVCLLSFFINDI